MKHFCKNEMYIPDEHLDFPLGFGIFWEVIVPRILEITEHIGCQYLYLFAADHMEQADSKTSRKQRGCLAGILRYLWSLLDRQGKRTFGQNVQRFSFSCPKDSTYQQYNTGSHCNLTEPIFFLQKLVTFDDSPFQPRQVE